MSGFVAVLAVLILAGLGAWIWAQARQGGAGAALDLEAPIPCGQTQDFDWGGKKILVTLKESCADSMDLSIGSGETWEPVQELRAVATGNRSFSPTVGDTYALEIPVGQKLRISCPAGTGRCLIKVREFTVQLRNQYRLWATDHQPACAASANSRFFNFTQRNISGRVVFTDVCKDAANRPQAPEIRQRQVRGGVAVGAMQNARNAAGRWEWEGTLSAGHTLMVTCPGSRPGCSFYVTTRG